MVIYEITSDVAAEIADSYERYMIDSHIPDLLATGCFREVRFVRSDVGKYRVHYFANDRDALSEYLLAHSSRLREDFAVHFPAGIEVARENWDVLGSWTAEANSRC